MYVLRGRSRWPYMTAIQPISANATAKNQKPPSVGIGISRLKRAFAQVRADSRDDFLPDLIGYREFSTYLDHKLASVLKVVGNYHPSSVTEFEVPKSPYSSRPGSCLCIEDRVVYQAAVSSIATLIDRHLEPRDVVYGFRVAKNQTNRMLDHNVNRWLEMRKALRLKRKDFSYLVRTDLVGYFEHIDHRVLTTEIDSLGARKPVTDLLRDLLKRWETSTGHGLPQNLEPSSLLANLYLDPLDKAMVRAGFRYFRFMDDIYILGNTKLETRKALQFLTNECRKRRLFLNSKKTEVMEGTDIDSFLSEDNDDRLNIDYLIGEGDPDQAMNLIHKLARKVGVKDDLNEREYKFLLGRLRKIQDPLLVKKSLGLLENYPHLSEQISRYLRIFASRRPTIQRGIFSFLASDANIFPWQEMWLLRCLFGCKKIDRKYLNWLRARAVSNQPWFNRSLYLLLLGRFGDESDRNFCWGFIGTNYEVDRAVVLSCQGSQKQTKLQRCNEAVSTNPNLFFTARLVKEQAQVVWPT